MFDLQSWKVITSPPCKLYNQHFEIRWSFALQGWLCRILSIYKKGKYFNLLLTSDIIWAVDGLWSWKLIRWPPFIFHLELFGVENFEIGQWKIKQYILTCCIPRASYYEPCLTSDPEKSSSRIPFIIHVEHVGVENIKVCEEITEWFWPLIDLPFHRSRVWPLNLNSYKGDPYYFFHLKHFHVEKRRNCSKNEKNRDFDLWPLGTVFDLRAWKVIKVTPNYYSNRAFWCWKRRKYI